MNSFEINRKAVNILCRGNFDKAQEVFYKNKNMFPGYQSYNNLGMFLYENGFTSKNGKSRCATSLGKKYVIKAIQYKNHYLIQKNLGRIFFDQQDYPSALRWFSLSYEQAKDDIVLYNLALSLIELHEYQQAIEKLESVIESVDDAYRVCLYCKAKVQKQTVSVFLKNRQYDEKKIDLIDQMYLFYLCNMYGAIVEKGEEITSEWGLTYGQWAVIIDSYIRCGKKDLLDAMISKEAMNYYNSKRYYRELNLLIYNDKKRIDIINLSLFPHDLSTIVQCGYFGCENHGTSWL